MLARSVMIVVFVLDKVINLGKKLTAERIPKALAMVGVCKSATVTKSVWKQAEWNEVNPTSEKPKFW